MKLNWLGYYNQSDGYGRYNGHLVKALRRNGVEVTTLVEGNLVMPAWMQAQQGIGWDRLTVSCMPAEQLCYVPGRHWLLTMTEGSEAPDQWVDAIMQSGVERVIVPCQHNAEAFRRGGVTLPISVIPGGIDPAEFPLRSLWTKPEQRVSGPFTFLTFADRGSRKGIFETWMAFYRAFGRAVDTPDVRLIIKSTPQTNEAVDVLMAAGNPDPRIVWRIEDMPKLTDFFAEGDCLSLPSRSEGWGLIYREAAATGLPVITQAYAGLDDGHTHEWAYVVEGGRMDAIPDHMEQMRGQWCKADVHALAAAMRHCYDNPKEAEIKGQRAAFWLRRNQTWDHAVAQLLELINGVGERGIPALSMTGG